MKKFLPIALIIAILTSALTSPGFTEEKGVESTKTSRENVSPAPEQLKFIDEVLRDYSDGKYRSFLKQADETYKKESKAWKYNADLAERKKLSTAIHDFTPHKVDKTQKRMASLQEEEDRELIELCLSVKLSPLTREIKDMVFFTPSQHERESLQYLSRLSWKFKGEGESPLENALIDIDLEFWLKTLALGKVAAQNQISTKTFQQRQTVLQLEKLRQLLSSCQERGADPKTRNHIETAQKIYPKVQASNVTRKHLQDLALGNVLPRDSTENSVKAIAVKYYEKRQAMIREDFPEDRAY